MRALVIANGDPPSAALAGDLRVGAGLVVAADGGADKAAAIGITVDAIIGDLDSVSAAAGANLPAAAIRLDADPENTDLEKAVRFCIAAGATEVDVIGAGGGRADHALANLSVLTLLRGHDVRLVDDTFTISLANNSTEIPGEPGTIVSLVAIGACQGVTTSGLRWDLADATLPFGTRGVHNEISRSPATISVREGDLLLFRGHRVERHQ